MQVLNATNTIKDRATGKFASIETPTYNGTLIGPTLKVKPGDTIKIDLVNDFPPNLTVQRMGGFPHDPFTTNFHTHGLTVSPQGISDNIYRLMEPGTISPIEIDIPSDHQCGTFWYHPHKHGSVSFQFFGGMSGFLIIEGCEGGLENVPEIADAQICCWDCRSFVRMPTARCRTSTRRRSSSHRIWKQPTACGRCFRTASST